MAERFKITWEAEDGYVSGSRPHHTSLLDDDFETDTSEKELREIFWQAVQDDFANKVSPVSDQEEEFLAWAKERQAAMEERP